MKPLLILKNISRLDIAAVSYAAMLSLACLARGAVYDVVIALLLFTSMPVLFLASCNARPVHQTLKIIGVAVLIGLVLVVLLQQRLVSSGNSQYLWQQVQIITDSSAHAPTLHDKSAWLQGIGRILLFTSAFVIALFIGSSESASRRFLQALLVSGTLCLAATFFVKTANGIPLSSFSSYAHGFVNSNTAATYLGIMLLLALVQASRFFRRPTKFLRKSFPDIIDQLNIPTMMQGFFLLFSILLTLAGLFMTGSRAGIFFSLFCGFSFLAIVGLKTNIKSSLRKSIIGFACTLAILLLVWVFFNFGETFMRRLERDGIHQDMRLEIFSSVVPMIVDHPLLGVGLGNFAAAFQQYRPDNVPSEGTIDKAHNSYLEFAAEMGLPAFVLLMAAILLVGKMLYSGVKGRKERYLTPTLGLAVWLLAVLHSLCDFPFQIPGLAVLFITIVTVCVSQTDPRFSEPASSLGSGSIKRIRIRKQRPKK